MPAVELEKVVGLQDHVVELEKRQRLLAVEARFHRLEGQHPVDREVPPDVAQEIEIVEPVEPRGIVEHERVALPVAIDEVAPEDAPHRGDVGVDLRARQQRALVGAKGGIAHLGGAPAHQRDRPVPACLQPAQHHDVEKMPDMQRGRGRVVADIGGHRARPHRRVQPLEIGAVRKIAARLHDVQELRFRLICHGACPGLICAACIGS